MSAAAAKSSSGCGTDDLANSSDDGDDERFRSEQAEEEAAGAAYTAELIRDAVRDIDLGDDVSAYERRLALREVKCVLRDAYRDRGEEPPTAIIKEYLRSDEHLRTNEQFVTLRSEMFRILKETEEAETRVRQLCLVLKAAWRELGHRPQDLFEMAVWKKGQRLQPTKSTEAVLRGMIKAWAHFEHIDDEFERGLSTGQMRIRLKSLLCACSVPEARALEMCQDPDEGPALASAVCRLESSLPEYQLTLDAVQRLPRDPVPLATSCSKDQGGSALDAVEDFVEVARDVLRRARSWQSMSGAPFFVSRGEKLRFGVPIERIGDAEPFTMILQRSLTNAEKLVPCRPMR